MLKILTYHVWEDEWFCLFKHTSATFKHSISDHLFGITELLNQKCQNLLKVLLYIGQAILKQQCDKIDWGDWDFEVDIRYELIYEGKEVRCICFIHNLLTFTIIHQFQKIGFNLLNCIWSFLPLVVLGQLVNNFPIKKTKSQTIACIKRHSCSCELWIRIGKRIFYWLAIICDARILIGQFIYWFRADYLPSYYTKITNLEAILIFRCWLWLCQIVFNPILL